MATYINIGDTLEGESMDCDGRTFFNQGMKKHPITKKTMHLYTTDNNSHAIITSAGKIPENQEIKEATKDYHREQDDRLNADALSIYTDMIGSVKIDVIHGEEGATHRHGTQFSSFKKHTIATIKMALPNLMKQLGFSNNSITDKSTDK